MTYKLLLFMLLAACGGAPEAAPSTVTTTVLGAGDLATVVRETISAGPRVSGTLEAAEKAVMRAEASGSVEVVAVEVGQRVKKGELLARIEANTARQTQISASAGVTAAEQDLANAEREAARARQLVGVGALATRDQEMAESAAIAAKARLKDARARAAGANQGLDGTTLRAPFDGIVSERAVNQGDVVAPGAPMFTVLEPSSLRVYGGVTADAVALLKVGALVTLEIQGHPGKSYQGTIERVAPAVDAATRQIPVIVGIPNAEGELMAGLFAEGRVASEAREGLVAPSEALMKENNGEVVLRVRNGVVEKAVVTIGLRDEQTERVEILTGVEAGDTLLVGPAREVTPGTAVAIEGATPRSEG